MDLISRQAAIDAFEAYKNCIKAVLGDENELIKIVITCRNIIDELPSAQPEIVRCKDCKFWREHKYAKETKRYLPFCGLNAIYTKSDDFCSKGERITDDKRRSSDRDKGTSACN